MTRLAAFSLALPFAFLTLSGCATVPDAPIMEGFIAPEGSAVPLGMAVAAGEAVLTPMRVVEDSRCPMNARCVRAGRVIVETRVNGAGWRETVPMTMGEPVTVRTATFALVSAEPNKMAGDEPPAPSAYRFNYEVR